MRSFVRTTKSLVACGGAVAVLVTSGMIASVAMSTDARAESGNTESGNVRAPGGLHVRSGPGEQYRVIGGLPDGAPIDTTGPSRDGYAPIRFGDRAGWIAISNIDGSARDGEQYATAAVYVRTGATINYREAGMLFAGERVEVTGERSGDYSEVKYFGDTRWVATRYLADTRVPDSDKSDSGNSDSGEPDAQSDMPAKKSPDTRAPEHRPKPQDDDRPSGDQDRVDVPPGLHRNAQRALVALQGEFPELKTIHGKRNQPGSDHNSGRALDAMIPDYQSNSALGDRVAKWAQSNADKYAIDYVQWNQKIWSAGRADEGWRNSADRGSDTQNHRDNVHISFRDTPPTSTSDNDRSARTKAANTNSGKSDSSRESERRANSAKQTCKASFYSEGQQTASGERFNPNAMTAAHKTLPFGTQVTVTNPKNGKSVDVRINDRGPFIDGRCLDLSRAAFAKIGDLNSGVITVDWTVKR